jgi:hypothetical protein
MVRTFGRWDCINARQREMAKEARFAACTSPLTSPATHRPPPKCGAFRLQPRGSPLRQTGCWRKPDSNDQSRSEKSGRSETRHIGSLVIGPAQAGTNPGKGTRSSNPASSSGESSANRTSSIKPRMQPWRKRRFTRARAAQAWADDRRLNGALLAHTQRHRERPSLVGPSVRAR